jgi:hypothetical protein
VSRLDAVLEFPRISLLGSSVNKEQVDSGVGVLELVNATKFRDVDKETSFDTAHEMVRAYKIQRGALVSQTNVFETA